MIDVDNNREKRHSAEAVARNDLKLLYPYFKYGLLNGKLIGLVNGLS